MAKKKKSEPKDPASNEDGKPVKSGPGFLSQIIIAVALGAASFTTVYLLPAQGAAPGAEHVVESTESDELEGVFMAKDELSYVKLDDITLTLGDFDRILKMGITLETYDDGETYVDPSDPVLRDAFTGYLRALRLEQIQDAAFMVQLRTQLLRRAKLVHGDDIVHGVLITDFLVQ